MSDWFVPHDLDGPIAGAAGGPLAGTRVAVKDSYDVAGARTGAGSPEWLAEQEPASAHAAAVGRLLDAGATVVGKAISDELFFSITGVSAHYGTPRNTRAPGRIPGGSSSGSAAATAAGACDIGLGTDTGGSIRAPSAFCGLYGLRPTHGRVDLAGCVPMAPSFDVAGWMARGAETLAAVGPVLLDGAGAVPGPVERVVVAKDAFAVADAPVAEAALAALDQPEAERIIVAPGGFDRWREAFRVIQGFEVWRTFGQFVERARPALGPGVRERIAYSSSVTRAQADAAREVAAEARAHLRAIASPGAAIALPTVPCVAAPADIGGHALEALRTRIFRLMCLAGLAGLPQLSMPAGTVDGCPVALSLIGWPGGDEALLALAVDRQDDLAGGAA